MKKKILLCLLFLPAVSKCQITFTGNDLPHAGTQWNTFSDSPPTGITTVTPASSSAQNWNYTNAFSIDDTSAIDFVDPAPLFGYSYFPNSNLAVSIFFFGPINDFFRSDNSGFYLEGEYASFPASTQLKTCTNKLLLPAPITYGTTVYNSSRSIEIEIYDTTSQSPATMHITNETQYFKCDAWGTMSTPFASNVSVLRLRSGVLSTVDSSFIDSSGTATNFVFNLVTSSGPGVDFDIMFICNSQTLLAIASLDSSTNTISNTTLYNSTFTGIEQIKSSAPAFDVYPNPVSGSTLYISTDDHVGKSDYEILNSLSGTVKKGSFNGSFLILEANLTAGIYFVRITNTNGTATKKIVVR
jgi:hypothetical protein